MTLAELKRFMQECADNGIVLDRDRPILKVAISDFFEQIPEEHQLTPNLEYNQVFDGKSYTVLIVPDNLNTEN